MSLAGIPAAWLIPQMAGRMRDQRWLAPVAALGSFIGVLGIISGVGPVQPLAVALVGLGQSASFSLALSLLVLCAEGAAVAAALSGFAQSVGFLIGAAGPWVSGYLAAVTGNWTAGLVFLVPVVAMEGCLRWVAGRAFCGSAEAGSSGNGEVTAGRQGRRV